VTLLQLSFKSLARATTPGCIRVLPASGIPFISLEISRARTRVTTFSLSRAPRAEPVITQRARVRYNWQLVVNGALCVAANATPCVVRRIPVRILSRRLLVLSFSLPFSIDSDVTDQSLFPWRKRETKGREEKRAEREKEREREKRERGSEVGPTSFFISFDSWNKLVQRERERERKRKRGSFGEQALKGSSKPLTVDIRRLARPVGIKGF